MLPGCFLVAGWSNLGVSAKVLDTRVQNWKFASFFFFASCFAIVKWRFARAADRLRVQTNGDGSR